MAGAYAVAAVGKAILTFLESACPRSEFATAEFELYQAKNFTQPMEEGIVLYLHRITPANNIRNLPPRVAPDGTRYRPSLSIDLHYLLIPYARDAFKQQRLLGWAMRAMEDHTVLNAGLLNEPGPEPDLFFDAEAIDVIMETLPIQDIGSIWEVAKPKIEPAVPYVVRMLLLDSTIEMAEGAPVQTRVFGMGEVAP
jgi:uncharacterized protein DUF4255